MIFQMFQVRVKRRVVVAEWVVKEKRDGEDFKQYLYFEYLFTNRFLQPARKRVVFALVYDPTSIYFRYY